MLVASDGTRGGTGIAAGAGPEKAADRPFTYSTTARISIGVRRSRKYGMALARSPSETTRTRSSSVGGWSPGVDLYLNWPRARSTGRGTKEGAAGPLPRPSGPWQTAQRWA